MSRDHILQTWDNMEILSNLTTVTEMASGRARIPKVYSLKIICIHNILKIQVDYSPTNFPKTVFLVPNQ